MSKDCLHCWTCPDCKEVVKSTYKRRGLAKELHQKRCVNRVIKVALAKSEATILKLQELRKIDHEKLKEPINI